MKTPRASRTKRQRLGTKFIGRDLCPRCGEPILSGEPFEEDHEIPLALGGPDTPANRRAMHVQCHAAKTAEDRRVIAKCERVAAKHEGKWRPARHPIPGSRSTRLRKAVDGSVFDRRTGQPLTKGPRS